MSILSFFIPPSLQVSILSQLEHPNVISLVGVCMRPKPMMLLEYAELGSLRSLYPYDHLSNMIKHRIALQVGIQYIIMT